jgi:phosphotransferase system  glucose/maltose/N-acetylglucosamine-specific IIC component
METEMIVRIAVIAVFLVIGVLSYFKFKRKNIGTTSSEGKQDEPTKEGPDTGMITPSGKE